MEPLCELDTMVLQEALAETEPWEIAIDLFLDDAALPRSYQPQLKQQSATSRRRTRHDAQRRQEIHELRKQVASLKQTLRRLANRVHHEGATSEAAALQRECKEIAARQHRSRFTAQIRNLQLRMIYEDHRRDAHQIQRLGHRLATLQNAIPRLLDSPTMDIFTMARVDPRLQVQRLPVLKRESDDVFQSLIVLGREFDRLTYRECKQSVNSSESLELIFESAWVLPFAVKDVADALWMQTTRVLKESNHVQWLDLHTDATSLVSQFLVVPENNSKETLKCGQAATHREYVADARAQQVTNVQFKEIQSGVCTTVSSSDVWARVEPIATSGDSSCLSQVLWYRRLRLQVPSLLNQATPERRRWIHNVVFGPVRAREAAMLTRNRQQMENLLVAKSVARAPTR